MCVSHLITSSRLDSNSEKYHMTSKTVGILSEKCWETLVVKLGVVLRKIVVWVAKETLMYKDTWIGQSSMPPRWGQ